MAIRHETKKKLDAYGLESTEAFETRKNELRPKVRDSLIIGLVQKEMLEQKEFAHVRQHFEKDWDLSLEDKTVNDPYVSVRINDRKTISVRVNKAHIEDESNKEILKSCIAGLIEPFENSWMSHVLRVPPASNSATKFAAPEEEQPKDNATDGTDDGEDKARPGGK